MTFTWDPSTLSSSSLQQVRLTIGDTVSARALLSDEEIEFRLSEHGTDGVLEASIACVRDILAQIARDVDKSGVGMQTTRSQKTTHYQDLLKSLESKAGNICEQYVGGVSEDAADTLESDDDWRQTGMTLDWGKNNG